MQDQRLHVCIYGERKHLKSRYNDQSDKLDKKLLSS